MLHGVRQCSSNPYDSVDIRRQIATLDKTQDRREIFLQRDDDKAFVQSLKEQVQAWGQVRHYLTGLLLSVACT